MGDIHGDLDAFETSLKVAGLVADKEGDWTGGDALLVQVSPLGSLSALHAVTLW